MTDRPVPEADIRPLMGSFPSGVSVVTTLDADGTPRGMTCSSLASVALSPPTLVICLRTASPTTESVLSSGQLALNLLHEDAHGTSDLFSSGNPERFALSEWRLPLGAGGPHLTEAAHAIADCSVVGTREVGDHTTVFAQVRRFTADESAQPLLYGRRRYARWSDATATAKEGAGRVGT